MLSEILPAYLQNSGAKCEQDEEDIEYSDNETEDFYVTLDLSSHVSSRKTKTKSCKVKGKSKAAQPDSQEENTLLPEESKDLEHSVIDPRLNASATPSISQKDNGSSSSEGVVFLNLHTKQPFVSYRGHLYLCDWNETIGTDVVIDRDEEKTRMAANPPPASVPFVERLSGSAPPLETYGKIFVTTSIKLSAFPAELADTEETLSGSRKRKADIESKAGAKAGAKADSKAKKSQKNSSDADLEAKAEREQRAFMEKISATTATRLKMESQNP